MGNRISGVILTGGDNKRFGGITKSNIVINGESIVSRIINIIKSFFGEIILVTNTPEQFVNLIHCKLVNDLYLRVGPLGGIHAALKSSSQDAIFVFAGDMPFLNKRIIAEQINEFALSDHDIIIPRAGQFIEPLHAIYRISVLKDLERFLSEKQSRSVKDFLNEMNTGYLDLPETDEIKKAFTNINSPSDIAGIIY
jgi:molybdopterin-guanine dinucleotide biosynthesis protein A